MNRASERHAILLDAGWRHNPVHDLYSPPDLPDASYWYSLAAAWAAYVRGEGRLTEDTQRGDPRRMKPL